MYRHHSYNMDKNRGNIVDSGFHTEMWHCWISNFLLKTLTYSEKMKLISIVAQTLGRGQFDCSNSHLRIKNSSLWAKGSIWISVHQVVIWVHIIIPWFIGTDVWKHLVVIDEDELCRRDCIHKWKLHSYKCCWHHRRWRRVTSWL